MKHYSSSMIAVIVALILPAGVIAGPCDAYFTFDGDLQDTGGNGYHGQMIGKDGALATPGFAEGNQGQALELDGTSAMRSFVDLHFDTCPQVTVTAWIQVIGTVRKGSQYLFSTGSGSGPGIRVSGTNLILSGSANGIIQRDAIRANAGWMFVAGIYDYTKGTYTLYSRNRRVDKEMGTSRKAPEEAIWVGAFNDGLAGPANGILIDDLRIYGQALSADELRAAQANAAADTTNSVGESCLAHDECPSGNYCAWDHTCHPESHAPLQMFELMPGTAPVEGIVLDEDAPFEDEPSEDELTASDDTIYSACEAPEDCAGAGSRCLEITVPAENTEGSMCTRSCTADSQCAASNAFSGACYSIGGSTASCYQRCDRDNDCNSGTRCISVTLPAGTLDGVCVPD